MLLHTWIAGLNEENFKDAKKYLPERWTTPTSPHSPLLVAPFGAGRRICPGKRFVDLALQLILAKVLLFLLFITFLDSLDLYIYIYTRTYTSIIFSLADYTRIWDHRGRRTRFAIWIYSRAKRPGLPWFPRSYLKFLIEIPSLALLLLSLPIVILYS